MPIYTKTGDCGETSLANGKKIKKTDKKITAFGNIDELNSFIGLLIGKIKLKTDQEFLTFIQKDLYFIMSFLSEVDKIPIFLKKRVSEIEQYIDKTEKKLPKLTNFILPQGTENSSWFHILRAVCRRAERTVVQSFNNDKTIKQGNKVTIMQYFNRLSDLFFIMARKYNKEEKVIRN